MSMREKIAAKYAERCNSMDMLPAYAFEIQLLIDCAFDALMEPTKPMVFVGLDAMSRDDLEPTEGEFQAGFAAAVRAAKEGK